MDPCRFLQDDGFLQNFIYYMNIPNVRDTIVQKFFKSQKNIQWWGTFYVSGSKKNMILDRWNSDIIVQPLATFFSTFAKQLQNDKINLYSICYQYDGNKVHYISDIYDAQTKRLIHFDPGISLYEHGQKTIIPTWEKQYRKYHLLGKSKEIGKCDSYRWHGKQMGVQFDESNSMFPADAFCQSWTIFFFYRLSLNIQDLSFMKNWCAIPPSKRKLFLLSNFILPFLMYERKHYQKICKIMRRKNCNSLSTLYNSMEHCFARK
jgi:hypothetical protein